MNRSLRRASLLVFLFVAPLVAETHRYLVGTRGPVTPADLPFSVHKPGARQFETFESVHGYVAELTAAEVTALRRSRRIRLVEPDAERFLLASPGSAQIIPWGVSAVRAPLVWPVTSGAGVRVAIIDTGIDLTHPDLQASYRGGYDFIHDDDVPEDEREGAGFSHGTHMAGTIAAANNQFGVVGIAPRVELYALKIYRKENIIFSSDVIRAIDWAVSHGVEVLNCSFGGPNRVTLEEEALARAAAADVLVVSAAGNDGIGAVTFPAAYSSVIAVSGISEDLSAAAQSNWGAEVDLAAPGVAIRSTFHAGRILVGGVWMSAESFLTGWILSGAPDSEFSGPISYGNLGRIQDLSSDTSGSIVVMEQGEIPADEKLRNARQAGARGAVLFPSPTGDCNIAVTPDHAALPLSVCLSRSDAQLLLGRTGQPSTVGIYFDDYAPWTGTSSAAAHVSGVAALLRSLAPEATAAQIRQVMIQSARDLGPAGFDVRFGHGLVDAWAAARLLAPQQFPLPRRRSVRN